MLLLGGWWDPHLSGLLELWQRQQSCWRFPRTHGGSSHTFGLVARGSNPTPALLQPTLKGSGHLVHSLQGSSQFWNITQSRWQEACTLSGDRTWSLQSSGLACTDPSHGLLQSDCSWDGNGVDRARSLAPHACHRRTSQPECWTCRQGNAGPTHRCSNVQHPAIDNENSSSSATLN